MTLDEHAPLSRSLTIIILFSDLGGGVPRRGAEAVEDLEERDGCLSLHREQRRATGGQQTYFYQCSLWVIVITVANNLSTPFSHKPKEHGRLLLGYNPHPAFCFAVSPVIHVPNQLVGAPLGTDVVLECFVEASPKTINYWLKDDGEISLKHLTSGPTRRS